MKEHELYGFQTFMIGYELVHFKSGLVRFNSSF
jgi:hypothetical protein